MLRSSPKPLLFVVIALLALFPGAALHAQDETPECYAFDLGDLRVSAAGAHIIVGGHVETATGDRFVLRPSFYLKGPAAPENIEVRRSETTDCPAAQVEEGTRIVAVLREGRNGLDWPGPSQVFTLQEGMATNSASPAVEMRETELIDRIRGETGQYAVPPEAGEESATIEWLTTVVPVFVALVVVFGIGIYLMRIWHRIDPS